MSTLADARAAVANPPAARLLAAELDDLAARVAAIDGKIAELDPEKEAALRAVAAIEAELAALQKELAAAVAVRRRVLGKLDSLTLTRRQLLGQRAVKAEQLARLRAGEMPVIRWAGGGLA